MERVVFLVEETGERIGCLLNPETVVVTRTAGIRRRRTAAGQIIGAGLQDYPLLYTGGGTTELTLDLLFDVHISGSSIQTDDVRDLTGPLRRLAENVEETGGAWRPPLVRLIWGRYWNILGVILAMAERFESFSSEGAPGRSWLRLRFARTAEAPSPRSPEFREPPISPDEIDSLAEPQSAIQTVGGGADAAGSHGVRLDEAADQAYGNPLMWRVLAAFNNIDNPLAIEPGTVLQVPPAQRRESDDQ